jgi:hypothetical protein
VFYRFTTLPPDWQVRAGSGLGKTVFDRFDSLRSLRDVGAGRILARHTTRTPGSILRDDWHMMPRKCAISPSRRPRKLNPLKSACRTKSAPKIRRAENATAMPKQPRSFIRLAPAIEIRAQRNPNSSIRRKFCRRQTLHATRNHIGQFRISCKRDLPCLDHVARISSFKKTLSHRN